MIFSKYKLMRKNVDNVMITNRYNNIKYFCKLSSSINIENYQAKFITLTDIYL